MVLSTPSEPDGLLHLRVLTHDDAAWMVELDRTSHTMARRQSWSLPVLERRLADEEYANAQRWGWAIELDGLPCGWAIASGLDTGECTLEIRLEEDVRGRGLGREILRRLADHHFSAASDLTRISGRTHEHNIAMQRAFSAAGYRMEARYRHTFPVRVGQAPASEWGYALTREDWEAGRHRADDRGHDLHARTFVVEGIRAASPHVHVGVTFTFLQEGRRVFARYDDGQATIDGELGGTLVGDVLTYSFVHDRDGDEGDHQTVTGTGRGRIQRRQGGLLEIVNDWQGTDGRTGVTVLIETDGEPGVGPA